MFKHLLQPTLFHFIVVMMLVLAIKLGIIGFDVNIHGNECDTVMENVVISNCLPERLHSAAEWHHSDCNKFVLIGMYWSYGSYRFGDPDEPLNEIIKLDGEQLQQLPEKRKQFTCYDWNHRPLTWKQYQRVAAPISGKFFDDIEELRKAKTMTTICKSGTIY